MGVANATLDTLHALNHLFPESDEVHALDLLEIYGPPAPLSLVAQPTRLAAYMLRECLDVPFSTANST